MHLLRIVDRAGVLDGVEEPGPDISIMTGIPEDIATRGIDALLKKKVFSFSNGSLCMPNFIEAQETPKSDRLRQRESRERRRAKAAFKEFTKEQAHSIVSRALTNGELKKEKCELCGSDDFVDAHHEDYNAPLSVRWLCRSCHGKHHRSRNVTESHEKTISVTDGHSLPCLADPLPCVATPYVAIQTKEDRVFDKKDRLKSGIDPYNANSDPEFMKLWNACPRRQGQHPAYLAWQDRCDSMTTGGLVSAMEAQAAAGMIGGASKLQLKGWIEGKRWCDEVVETDDHRKSEEKRNAELGSMEIARARENRIARQKAVKR